MTDDESECVSINCCMPAALVVVAGCSCKRIILHSTSITVLLARPTLHFSSFKAPLAFTLINTCKLYRAKTVFTRQLNRQEHCNHLVLTVNKNETAKRLKTPLTSSNSSHANTSLRQDGTFGNMA